LVDFSTEESVVDVDDIADFLMKDNERSLLGIKVFGADDALPIVLGDALGPNLLVDPSAFVKRTSLVEDELEATAEDDKVFSDVSKGDDVVAMLPMNSFDDFEAPMMENFAGVLVSLLLMRRLHGDYPILCVPQTTVQIPYAHLSALMTKDYPIDCYDSSVQLSQY